MGIFCEKGAVKVEKGVPAEGNRMLEHMRPTNREEAAGSGGEQGWRWRGEVEKKKIQPCLKICNKTQ